MVPRVVGLLWLLCLEDRLARSARAKGAGSPHTAGATNPIPTPDVRPTRAPLTVDAARAARTLWSPDCIHSESVSDACMIWVELEALAPAVVGMEADVEGVWR